MDQRIVESVVITFTDGSQTVVSNETQPDEVYYKVMEVHPDGVGTKGQGRYLRHEIWWTDAPINEPYGSESNGST